MVTAVIGLLVGIALASIYFIVTTRRHTPYLELDLDSMPKIAEGLNTLAGLTAAAVHHGNDARVLQNGAVFPAMLEDIRGARHTVHLETFVWTTGKLEREFIDVLCAKAREGVKVRVLIDAMGGMSAKAELIQQLKHAGGEMTQYCRPRWWNLRRFNHRTHRKLLMIDGEIGYTFGHGVADQWLGEAQDEHHWRDTAVRLEGPVVYSMQAVFMENWIEETHCVPAGPGCFPELQPKGDISAHVVSSASGEEVSSVALLYTVAIACARREVIIQNPYFAPDDGVCELLAMMVKRGVVVHLMVPGRKTDSPFVRRAGCYLYASLLEAGVHVYEFEPTLLHQKIVIVDGFWSHVGSTNFDSRSLALNEEVGIGLFDEGVAQQLIAAFRNDLRRSTELKREEWIRRPWYDRVWEWTAYRLHDVL
ncbi:MAG: cardiolipin synthase [Steroidobacteraceae bacterium]